MTQIGSVYGEALYGLAREEGLDKTIMDQLSVLNQSFRQEADFVRLLSTPNLSKQDRCRVVDDCFRGKVQPYVLNFLKILTERGYVHHFSDCCKAYRALYNRDHGILPVTAVTAVALSDDQSRRLTEKLGNLTGKTIELTNRVDPACMGGVRLNYDGKQLDDTVAHRLDAIRGLLRSTVL